MNELKFNCLHCGQKLQCNETLVGKPIVCPSCRRSLIVPSALAGSVAVASAVESSVCAPAEELPTIRIPTLSIPEPESVTPTQRMKLRLAGRRERTGQTSKLAIAAFASSLLGPFGFLPAVVCGHLAKWRIRKTPGLKGGSLATAGLVIGYLSAIFIAVFVLRSALKNM